jgi:hypothetical protein
MLATMLCAAPISLLSFYALHQGNIVVAQLGLILLPSGLAPIHVVMNALFPIANRGRSVGLLFMSGLSIGGLVPSFSGYLVAQMGFQFMPAILVSIVACIAALSFYRVRDLLKSELLPILHAGRRQIG